MLLKAGFSEGIGIYFNLGIKAKAIHQTLAANILTHFSTANKAIKQGIWIRTHLKPILNNP